MPRFRYLMFALAVVSGPSFAAPPKSDQNVRLTHEEWKGVARTPLQPGEIDKLITKELAAAKIKASPMATDEQFLRRVMLDLVGRLPLPADVTEFVADKDSNKRSKLIDKLLASPEYADHWAKYWRDVFASKVTDRRGQSLTIHFEAWLKEQLSANKGWDAIAKEILTADGQLSVQLGRSVEPDAKNGAAYFLLSYQGNDAIYDRTAETSRVFLGIQIQCAQCHDHPFDGWKRTQFHELAGYFSRLRERPVFEERRIIGVQLVSRPFGEHQMPDLERPEKGTPTLPKFLDGSSVSSRSGDADRRKALAAAIASPSNYSFAAAYVNRIWGEMMGQAFRSPVDDMGPGKDVVMPEVLSRVSAAFAGSKFDMKALFRAICTSDAYQRQIRPGEPSQHSQFAGITPARLQAEALWKSLTTVLGAMSTGQMFAPPGPLAARAGLEGQFKQEFQFDPSLPAAEVEGSIPQALMLMNNPQINQKIRAEGSNLLARILSSYPKDDEAIRMVYLRTLSRKPTDRERDKALSHIAKVGKRSEAFEDLLWALLNSTEFQTKR